MTYFPFNLPAKLHSLLPVRVSRAPVWRVRQCAGCVMSDNLHACGTERFVHVATLNAWPWVAACPLLCVERRLHSAVASGLPTLESASRTPLSHRLRWRADVASPATLALQMLTKACVSFMRANLIIQRVSR